MNMLKNRRARWFVAPVILIAMIGSSAAACGSSAGNHATTKLQNVTDQAARQLNPDGTAYPLDRMKNSDELANLRERLLRMNDPHKVGYLYELTTTGEVLAEYTVQGKVSSTQSQILNSQFSFDCGNNCGTPLDSMGDDGSYGPEEGGPNGIFFFTSTGVLVEWNGLWQYSDAPLVLTSKPLITIDANAKPSSVAGQLK